MNNGHRLGVNFLSLLEKKASIRVFLKMSSKDNNDEVSIATANKPFKLELYVVPFLCLYFIDSIHYNSGVIELVSVELDPI